MLHVAEGWGLWPNGGLMRGKGINYDTGFMPGNHSRPDFDPAVVAAEIRVIARELGCTAVRITGADAERIGVAARAAAVEGLEVWFSPFPVEVLAADLIGLFRDCADRAEQLRRDGAAVVLVIGCELTLFNPGYLPGTFFYDRIRRLVRYMQEVNQIFVEEGLDLAFWFTFAGYHMPASSDPHRDADLASYGLVSLLPEGPGRGYQGLGWRPRLAFETMAALQVR
jgi:hypothetical protein